MRSAAGSGLWTKHPRYYCENCGAEVAKDAKVCPHCGSFFSSIKCPRCGYVGKADDFALGCPSCGSTEQANPAPEPMRPHVAAAPPVPWWAFVAAAVVLLGLTLLLFSTLR